MFFLNKKKKKYFMEQLYPKTALFKRYTKHLSSPLYARPMKQTTK